MFRKCICSLSFFFDLYKTTIDFSFVLSYHFICHSSNNNNNNDGNDSNEYQIEPNTNQLIPVQLIIHDPTKLSINEEWKRQPEKNNNNNSSNRIHIAVCALVIFFALSLSSIHCPTWKIASAWMIQRYGQKRARDTITNFQNHNELRPTLSLKYTLWRRRKKLLFIQHKWIG